MPEPRQQPEARYGVEFFPYSADVNERIAKWAAERGVKVLRKVPVYYGGPQDGRR